MRAVDDTPSNITAAGNSVIRSRIESNYFVPDSTPQAVFTSAKEEWAAYVAQCLAAAPRSEPRDFWSPR